MCPDTHHHPHRPLPAVAALLLLGLSSGFAQTFEEDPPHTTRGTFYQNPSSYSTTRDTDPPRYARNVNEIGIDSLLNVNWLDVGLDYRFRYEYRDDDLRRENAGRDEPWLHRTRAYIGIKEILDPFRLAVELQDSRRENSHYVRDNRDVNKFEFIRLYGELYFKDLLGHDAIGTPRPLSIRYGIHNFEFLDRRLIGNNQWRNTANTFLGFHASMGQESNDWQVDLLALQPLRRDMHEWDRPVEQQWMYAVIGHWRGWAEIITLEPYYLALHQSAQAGVLERMVHNPGVRGYGVIADTGFDYDASFNYQLGQNGPQKVRAWAATAELGYNFKLPWKTRFSLFYGQATGDRDPNDGTHNRFEKFFGFGRPWSANDYIVYENIRTPKLRLECVPSKTFRFDLGFSWYWLDSASDRFAAANNARDTNVASGSRIGHEFDIRTRFALGGKTELILGYAHFSAGGFIEKNVRRGDTDFAYLEFSHRFF